MPPPLKKEEEEEDTVEQGSDFMPDRNPYGGGKQMGEEGTDTAAEGTTSKSKRFSSFRAYDGHTRGQDMDEVPPSDVEEVVEDQQLVHIQGEVGTTAVKDGNNYLMLTCIILLLLGIGLALFAYNNRKAKVEAHYHTLSNEAYGSV